MNYSHLWNDMPIAERTRLQPFLIEKQIQHLKSSREIIARRHAATLKELDDWIANLERSLTEATRELAHT